MLKIAITGPESVGKSTLARQLAELFNGIFVCEFARDYVQNLNRKYSYNDVVKIAKMQCQQYDELLPDANQYPVVFFDTFLIITKVWFEYVWNKYPNWLDEAITSRKMDLYLLCSPDIPWQADDVRENGNIREELFERYKKLLQEYGFKYEIVSGLGDERLKNAKNIIDQLKILK
jgi:NadR type nicotinamide-nucleotide adenylyltransferase